MRRIMLSLLVIVAVAGASIQLSSAFFSDTETSTNNTFQAGTIDLLLNGENNPTAIVSFGDLKPGDTYTQPDKTLRVVDNDAYVWMHIKDVETSQGEQTEPEDVEENGTPQHNINDYLTYALTVGSTSVINPAINFNDAVSCWIPFGVVTGGQVIPMNQTFHFDDEVTNWAQGDTMTFTEEFYAVQARNNESPTPPVSETGRVWNEETGTCQPIECLEMYASLSFENNQGTRKDGGAILANRTVPSAMFGTPETSGLPADSSFPVGSFFSLGFTNGNIVIGFDSPFYNKPGNDLQIFEVTGGAYPDESVRVEISSNPFGPWTEVAPTLTRDGFVDMGSVPSAQYVRLTDVSNINLFANDADGYDVDAVKAFCGSEI